MKWHQDASVKMHTTGLKNVLTLKYDIYTKLKQCIAVEKNVSL
jgi:hypothetical protein